MGLIITLIIGGLVGWLASILMKTDAEMGWVANIVAGIIGSWLGTALLGSIITSGTPTDNGVNILSLIVSILGACLAIFLWQLFTGRRTV